MSQRINRREFSGLMAGGLALLSDAAPAWAQPAGTISVRQTADTKRFAEEPALKWQPAEGSSDDGIVLDPSRTYQEMLGFGGALTDASRRPRGGQFRHHRAEPGRKRRRCDQGG